MRINIIFVIFFILHHQMDAKDRNIWNVIQELLFIFRENGILRVFRCKLLCQSESDKWKTNKFVDRSKKGLLVLLGRPYSWGPTRFSYMWLLLLPQKIITRTLPCLMHCGEKLTKKSKIRKTLGVQFFRNINSSPRIKVS